MSGANDEGKWGGRTTTTNDDPLEEVSNMKAHLDNSCPSTLGMKHLQNRLKKRQLAEERYAEIERENRCLVEKMTRIMKSGTGRTGAPSCFFCESRPL